MKPRPKDYLTISAALLAIFFSGYGVGFLLGEKQGRKEAPAPIFAIPEDRQTAEWQENTLAKLSNELSLNNHQKKAIAHEIHLTSLKFGEAYDHTLQHISRQQLELLDNILPHLTDDQQDQVKKHRKNMEKSIQSRFLPR